jgi:YcxB-like protein
VTIEYTLDAEDVAAARLLALGVRPRVEFALFTAALTGLAALSVSRFSFGSLRLLIGLTACLGAFRLTQINKVRHAAVAAFSRNPTLRQATVATWDEEGITIQPLTAMLERISWSALEAIRENARVVVFLQPSGAIHAVPKRAFADKSALDQLRRQARAGIGQRR